MWLFSHIVQDRKQTFEKCVLKKKKSEASKDFLKGLKGVLPFWFGSEILLDKCGSSEATECSSRDGEGTQPCGII